MTREAPRPFAPGRPVNPSDAWVWRCPEDHAHLEWSSATTICCLACRRTYDATVIVSARDGAPLTARLDHAAAVAP